MTNGNKKAASGAGNTTDSKGTNSIDSVAQSGEKRKTVLHVDDAGDGYVVEVCGSMGKLLPAFCALTEALANAVPHGMMCAVIMTALNHAKINPLELAAMKIKSQECEHNAE